MNEIVLNEREQKFYADLFDDLCEVVARAAGRADREGLPVPDFCGSICAAFTQLSFEVLVEAMTPDQSRAAIVKAADHMFATAALGETRGPHERAVL
jgi:hypothetical protein